ncbi:Deoxyhypusine synthase [Puttea exsequens]|nr:Deoxyhypusine synthase [Puttea exsequens]
MAQSGDKTGLDGHGAPATSTDAVFKPSVPVPAGTLEVDGIDFEKYSKQEIAAVSKMVNNMAPMGFQASAIADAVQIINDMVELSQTFASLRANVSLKNDWRDPDDPSVRTTIFLGYTSNLVSSGLRSVLRYLVRHKHVSAIVTTAGGIEEDIIKCLAPTYLGSFSAPGAALRERGMNRIGNLVVPNSNYGLFEDWIMSIFAAMFAEQEASRKRNDEDPVSWPPSKLVSRLGEEIAKHPNCEQSICYWAWKNDIPIFSPALTDGSLGDMLSFFSYRIDPKWLDINIHRDIRRINDIAMKAKRAGMIILGAGLVKHHIANACLMRNGADSAVYINTAQEFDGSDAGARPDEAVSWGKIKAGGQSVKVSAIVQNAEGRGLLNDLLRLLQVYVEATVAFPLIVAATFAGKEPE